MGESAASIVVTIDGSEESRRALQLASRLATALGQHLVILTVVPPPPVYPVDTVPILVDPPQVTEAYRKSLEAASQEAKRAGIVGSEAVILEGPVVDTIVQFLRERQPTMAVIGARGLSAGARLFLGSVSDGVVHHAPCPVLVVRNPSMR